MNTYIPFIPVHIKGMTCTVRGNKIEFTNGAIREALEFLYGSWVYTSGDGSRIRLVVDEDEMDLILIGWYTAFDHSTNGLAEITIRAFRDDDITEIRYKN